MKRIVWIFCFAWAQGTLQAQLSADKGPLTVQTANGLVRGSEKSGITIFKGVPYAQPPVGDLRWREPQPVKNWEGIKNADHFSARAMQLPIYSDMMFRSDSMSEDCLYLNIWTPSKTGKEALPVLVYFYGGGFSAGDGSELRYDGESMSRKGIVSITVNYRLGVFGFMAHPDLTQESPHHASGNYGLMDQTEAIRWVHKNIAAFGGDPDNITIAGESAGSFSVSAQVITPLTKNLLAGAIGESGSLLELRPIATLKEAEQIGSRFADSLQAHSIRELRSIPAADILKATAKPNRGRFWVDIDGYFFPESPIVLYKTGRVNKIPLLIGWNSAEAPWQFLLGGKAPTVDNFIQGVKRNYPKNADDILKLYVVKNDSDVERVATDLASDGFIVFSTWNWAEQHLKTNSPVYRYYFTQVRPGLRSDINKTSPLTPVLGPGTFVGSSHSTEIEYALGNLPTNRVYDWQPGDFMVSEVMQNYFSNFIKTKNPNGPGLPYWPLYQIWQKDPVEYIGIPTQRMPESGRERYLYLEKMSNP